jgi:hypothetical protein
MTSYDNSGYYIYKEFITIPGNKLQLRLQTIQNRPNDWIFDPIADMRPIPFKPGSVFDEDWKEHDERLSKTSGYENSYGISLLVIDNDQYSYEIHQQQQRQQQLLLLSPFSSISQQKQQFQQSRIIDGTTITDITATTTTYTIIITTTITSSYYFILLLL